ncbi:AP-4 complex accessory subunit tepsin isoform X2 [Anabrus simplex]|uniref:AP-4 complex accessory subunit tepsin isoform X2 n=1 Tax=Anabrus simplex TaxID=316456 RepID=UPI0034DDB749
MKINILKLQEPTTITIDQLSLPLLTRATAEDEELTPSYMLQEIEKITFQAEPHCQQLTEYLTRRLAKPSAVVKLKVLKIMLHLVHNGHVNFRAHLRRNDDTIKESNTFHGPPDPLLGTTRYETVRQYAQDLLEVLFDPGLLRLEEEGGGDKDRTKMHLGGLGSTGSTKGKYEGFGSSPIEKEETIKGKVLDIFEKLVNPVDGTAEVIKSALTSSPGNYEAVQIEQSNEMLFQPRMKKSTSTTTKAHTPGRAGGGWESDDDGEKNVEMKKSQKSSSLNSEEQVSTDSLENLETPSLDETTPEVQIVTEFCGIPKLPCSPSDLNEICKKCAVLNCVAVLKVVSNLLQVQPSATANDIAITRALLILEWFLRMDLVRAATISTLVSPNLTTLVDPSVKIGPAVKTKAEKVMLILEKLQAL